MTPFTCVNQAESDMLEINGGLGPLLFLVYVSDRTNAVPEVNVKVFADNTNLFVAGSSSQLLTC